MTASPSEVSMISGGQPSGELFKMHNEQPITTSTTQLKNSLKRSIELSYDKISKVRVTENSGDELEVIQLNFDSSTSSNKQHEFNDTIGRCLTKYIEKLEDKLANDCKINFESINDKTIKNILKSSEIQNALFDTIEKCLAKYNDKLQDKLVEEREFNTKLLKHQEKVWQRKYDLISKQLKELQTVMQTHKNDFELDVNSEPVIRTSTVNLQELFNKKSEDDKALMTIPPVVHMIGDYQLPDGSFKVHSELPATSTSFDNELTNGLTFPLQDKSLNDEVSKVRVTENINITESPPQPTISCTEKPSKSVKPSILQQQNSLPVQLLAVSPVIPGQLQSTTNNSTTNNVCQVPASQLPEPLSPIAPVHHYIPLPTAPFQAMPKKRPPAPAIQIKKCSERQNSISLIWDMSINSTYARIQNYQIFFYQERGTDAFKWRRIFESEALNLPITAYISQLMHKEIYHFAVRATDIHGRVGPISRPTSVCLM